MITEAEKSQDLPSAGWKPRKADGVIQSESEGLRTRGVNGINPSLRGEMRWDVPAHTVRQEKRGNYSFLHLFIFQALSGLGDAHPHWDGQAVCFTV